MRMPDCELLFTCPFFNDTTYEMAEEYKERYCNGDHAWCGRYMIWRERNMLEQEMIFTNNRGLWCPFKPVVCQEGYCARCQIYLDWQKSSQVRGAYRAKPDFLKPKVKRERKTVAGALRTDTERVQRASGSPNDVSIREEGRRIAQQLGVRYEGPQYLRDGFVTHLFTDVAVWGTTFAASTLQEARTKLAEKRRQFAEAER